MDYWMVLARDYIPYSYIELVDIQPAWKTIYKDERDNIIAQFHFKNVMPQDTLQITFTYRLQMTPYEFPKDNALIGYYDPTSTDKCIILRKFIRIMHLSVIMTLHRPNIILIQSQSH